MDNLGPCPRCGDNDGFFVREQSRGPIVAYYDETGRHYSTDMDKVYSRTSRTVRCVGCGKIRHDLVCDAYGVKRKGG